MIIINIRLKITIILTCITEQPYGRQGFLYIYYVLFIYSNYANITAQGT